MENFEGGFYAFLLRKLGFEFVQHPGRIPYARQRPKRLKPRTENQKENQLLFLYLRDWLAPLEEYVKVGYRNHPSNMDPMVLALYDLMRVAVIQHNDGPQFIPTLALISSGNLVIEDNFEVSYDSETSVLQVSWDTQHPPVPDGRKPASDHDRLMLLVYETWGGEAFGKVYGAHRCEGSDNVVIPPLGDDPLKYYLYLAFTSADGTSQSVTIAVDPALWKIV